MNIWLVLAIVMVVFIGSFELGMWYQKKKEIYVGTFVVDRHNPEIHGGLYTVLDVDPQKLQDRQRVVLDVITADVHSQQNQGT